MLAGLARRQFRRPGLGDVTFAGRMAAQFRLGHALQTAEFDTQHGGGVLKRSEVHLARGACGVNQRDDAEDVGARVGQDHPGLAMVDRTVRDLKPADKLPPLPGLILHQRLTVRQMTRGGTGVAVHILYENRERGELVQGLGNAHLSRLNNDLVQPTVDLHDLRKFRDR